MPEVGCADENPGNGACAGVCAEKKVEFGGGPAFEVCAGAKVAGLDVLVWPKLKEDF